VPRLLRLRGLHRFDLTFGGVTREKRKGAENTSEAGACGAPSVRYFPGSFRQQKAREAERRSARWRWRSFTDGISRGELHISETYRPSRATGDFNESQNTAARVVARSGLFRECKGSSGVVKALWRGWGKVSCTGC
jgi:hypothetical protein